MCVLFLRKFIALSACCAICAQLIVGCATRQNVGPLYDAAITNFESAQKLETTATTKARDARLQQINQLFAQLEQLAGDQIETVVVVRWNAGQRDFPSPVRDECWRAILGVEPGAELDPDDVTWAAGALARHLSHGLWQTKADPNAGVESNTVTGFDVLTNPGGVAAFTGVSAPPPGMEHQAENDYIAWHDSLREGIIGKMGAVMKVRQLRETMVRSLESEYQNRVDRIDGVYSALLDITRSAKSYAGALTSNSQFIELANKVVSLANGKLSDATASSPATSEPAPQPSI